MRLTTLLDTVNQGGSGPWPPSPITTDENDQQFDQMVAGLIPCRSNDPELWFAEQTAQVELAKALMADDENEAAEGQALRASEDAELAVLLARRSAAQTKLTQYEQANAGAGGESPATSAPTGATP